MKRTDPQLKLRLPSELRAKLDEAAEGMHRPVSSEIVARLEASFVSDPGLPGRVAALEARLANLEGRLTVSIGEPRGAFSIQNQSLKRLKAKVTK